MKIGKVLIAAGGVYVGRNPIGMQELLTKNKSYSGE